MREPAEQRAERDEQAEPAHRGSVDRIRYTDAHQHADRDDTTTMPRISGCQPKASVTKTPAPPHQSPRSYFTMPAICSCGSICAEARHAAGALALLAVALALVGAVVHEADLVGFARELTSLGAAR